MYLHDKNKTNGLTENCYIYTCPLNSSISIVLSRYHLVKRSPDTGELGVIDIKI